MYNGRVSCMRTENITLLTTLWEVFEALKSDRNIDAVDRHIIDVVSPARSISSSFCDSPVSINLNKTK